MGFVPTELAAVAKGRAAGKNIIALTIAGVCTWLVVGRLGALDLADLSASIGNVTAWQWAGAVLATGLSFAAVGQYDALFHRWLGTGVRRGRAVLSGAAAIALAQTLGFGLATGSIARWRALTDVSLVMATKLTNYVSFSFMIALGVLSAAATGVTRIDQGAGVQGAGLAVLALGVVISLSFFQPRWLPMRLPPLRLVGKLVLLAAIDTALAALALWVLLPDGMQPQFGLFLAAFLLALGAGLLSGAPGGVGPFELCMITLLPSVPETDLIAAILAFRLVYYALPACLALALLARSAPRREGLVKHTASLPHVVRAEAGLARQSGDLIAVAGAALHLAPASQTLIAIGDPASGDAVRPKHLDRLAKEARTRDLWPALYKCSGRSAAAARACGWSVMAISEEAWIEPAAFSPEGAPRRQFRRKLKQAARAGVSVELACLLPIAQMTRVARDWAERCGGERGFSMGRFEPSYLEEQRCYLAWCRGRLVAFASFHVAPGEWALDLVRSTGDVPDGTMHAVIARAVEDGKTQGIARLSLAAMPLDDPPAALRWLSARREAQGLRRFKTSFAPRRQGLYLAAPNKAVLALAAADILLRIARPARLGDAVPFHKPSCIPATAQLSESMQ